jgi:hypothetical protein
MVPAIHACGARIGMWQQKYDIICLTYDLHAYFLHTMVWIWSLWKTAITTKEDLICLTYNFNAYFLHMNSGPLKDRTNNKKKISFALHMTFTLMSYIYTMVYILVYEFGASERPKQQEKDNLICLTCDFHAYFSHIYEFGASERDRNHNKRRSHLSYIRLSRLLFTYEYGASERATKTTTKRRYHLSYIMWPSHLHA